MATTAEPTPTTSSEKMGRPTTGGISETQEMLEFCAAKQIYPEVEIIDMGRGL